MAQSASLSSPGTTTVTPRQMRENCMVVAAFITLHIAFIMALICLAVPCWSWLGEPGATRETYKESRGLWMKCDNGTCQSFMSLRGHHALPGWYHWVQFLYTVGTVILLAALALFYKLYLSLSAWPIAYNTLTAIFALIIGACLMLSVACIVYGVQSLKMLAEDTADVLGPGPVGETVQTKLYDQVFGWTFYVALVMLAFVLAEALQVTFCLDQMRRQKPPYAELD